MNGPVMPVTRLLCRLDRHVGRWVPTAKAGTLWVDVDALGRDVIAELAGSPFGPQMLVGWRLAPGTPTVHPDDFAAWRASA